jgi:hypothetical protein
MKSRRVKSTTGRALQGGPSAGGYVRTSVKPKVLNLPRGLDPLLGKWAPASVADRAKVVGVAELVSVKHFTGIHVPVRSTWEVGSRGSPS